MICLSGNLPALKIGHHHVVGYKTDWIEEALSRAAAASNRTDCPFIADIRDGILHYLEKRCSLRVFAIEDLYSRMRAMLRKIGCDDIAQHLSALAPPNHGFTHWPRTEGRPRIRIRLFSIAR